jgi:quercetin dioxygenase-like cupin family protein
MSKTREARIVPPGGGRSYAMGRIEAVFKGDGAETGSLYSLSEWRLEPRTAGPSSHAHDEEHLFYVIEGVLSVLVGEEWTQAPAGSCILLPGGTPHSFENRGDASAAFLSFNVPGGFEARMEHIAPALAAEDLRL